MTEKFNDSVNFHKDMTFSEKMMPYVFDILGDLPMKLFGIITPATPEDDVKHGTDLYIKIGDGGNIAVRIRRAKTDAGFNVLKADDVTIRYQINDHPFQSGTSHLNKTEFDKIKDGTFKAKYYFYGVANLKEDGIEKWVIWDVNKAQKDYFSKEGVVKRWRSLSANSRYDEYGDRFYCVPVPDLRSANAIIYEHWNLVDNKKDSSS
jgi:hypothetical protein